MIRKNPVSSPGNNSAAQSNMLLFPPSIEIGPNDGFDPRKDIFQRADMGRGLANLVGKVDEPLVIAVDGQWGSGKTTFLKMWAGELRNTGFPVIFFDAFEHDFLDDAFGAVAGEIIALLDEKKKLSTTPGRRFAKQAMDVAKVVGLASLKVGVKAASINLLDGSEFTDVSGDIADAAKGLTDKYLASLLKKRREQHNAVSAFRDALTSLPSLLSEHIDGKDAKPLIFIIDELDRCRPSFALELLERMKHFFSVRGVHFVLGVHIQQLHNSVSKTYGPYIDANLYLQKFIGLHFFLYDKADSERERTATKFIDYLERAMQYPRTNEVDHVLQVLKAIAVHLDISLRAIERIMTTISIALAFTSEHSFRPPAILTGLAILKVWDPDKFRLAKRGTLTLTDVSAVFGVDEKSDHVLRWAYDWWHYALTGEDKDGTFARRLSNYSIPRERIIPYLANSVIDRFTDQ